MELGSKIRHRMKKWEQATLFNEDLESFSCLDEEVLGIITLEDVMEELLQVFLILSYPLQMQVYKYILEPTLFGFFRRKFLMKLMHMLMFITSKLLSFKSSTITSKKSVLQPTVSPLQNYSQHATIRKITIKITQTSNSLSNSLEKPHFFLSWKSTFFSAPFSTISFTNFTLYSVTTLRASSLFFTWKTNAKLPVKIFKRRPILSISTSGMGNSIKLH